ncbi:hypothetical protein CROQUDRAFT_28308, partial [Cronartium quercuum f. sp. fusiforme G11]
LGHLNPTYLNKMERNGSINGLSCNGTSRKPCDVCIQSKSRRLPFSGTRLHASRFLQNIHVDL